MRNKLTKEEIVQRVKNINSNIEIIGEYINAKTKIKCKCLIDGYEWYALVSNLQKGQGCPKCGKQSSAKKLSKNHNTFIDEMYIKNNNIQIISTYINKDTKVKCKCLICNNIWQATPRNLLKGKGCPECAKEHRKTALRFTHQQFIDKLYQINSNIKINSKYYNSQTKIDCECIKCGYKWGATPNNLLSGYGCPYCRNSKGENVVSHFLDNKNINYITQYIFNDCKDKKPLPFDFYLPNYNMCIEYDGRQHFEVVDFSGHNINKAKENFNIIKEHDNIKTKYCQENNIKLLRIPYWEFNNIKQILDKELNN